MPRPRIYEDDAEKARAFRARRSEREKQLEAEQETLHLAARRLRHAFTALPVSLRGGVSEAEPDSLAASLEQVSAFLESLATLYPAPAPAGAQGEPKRRRK